jgi:hypothetical protein
MWPQGCGHILNTLLLRNLPFVRQAKLDKMSPFVESLVEKRPLVEYLPRVPTN